MCSTVVYTSLDHNPPNVLFRAKLNELYSITAILIERTNLIQLVCTVSNKDTGVFAK